MTHHDTKLIHRLQEAAKYKGVTMARARHDLQRLTGMTKSNMSHWFTGRTRNPSALAALVAADYFGVDARWMARATGKMAAGNKTRKGATMPDDVDALLQLARQMDEPTREAWRQTGVVLLELLRSKKAASHNGGNSKTARGKAKGRSRRTRPR